MSDFDRFYQEELQEDLQELELQRRKVQTRLITLYSIIGAGVLFLLITFLTGNTIPIVLACFCFVALVIGYFWYSPAHKHFVTGFKERVIRKMVRFIDPDFEYAPQDYIGKYEYENSGLFLNRVDRYRGDDFVSGMVGKTRFCFSELHTEEEVKRGKTTEWQTVFKGLFFIADFNKHFSGRTYVWSEYNPQLNFFNKLFSGFAYGLEKVKLESPDFEDKYVVYSSDQVEARYILTPSTMERMMNVRVKLKASVVFSFVNSNVYVAVPMKEDLFEPTIFHSIHQGQLAYYFETILLIIGLVDDLNLNLRIWTKE